MSNSLDGYVALITGGSSGLGHSHARVLAQRGANVAITDFLQKNLDRAKAELAADGVDVLCLKADNRVVAEVKAAVAAAERAFGKVDILVNNAGISGMQARIEDIDETFWDDLIDTHVKGAFFATQAVVPGMKQRRYGRIINTGSTFAMTGAPVMCHYTAAKGALTALTRAWARELTPFGITVNTVSPGLVETPMTRGDLTPCGDRGRHADRPGDAAGGDFPCGGLAREPRGRRRDRAEHQPERRPGGGGDLAR